MRSRVRRIVLLSLDAVRFDAVAATSHRSFWPEHDVSCPSMPHLDRFCRAGTTLTQALTTAPYTTAAHASVFTGRIPPQHGLRAMYRNALSADVPTLAELLRDRGFETLFLSDRPELFEPLGLARGFDRHCDADADWLEAVASAPGPLLAFAHLFDAHKPYLVSGSAANESAADDACRSFIAERSSALGIRNFELPEEAVDLFWSFQSALGRHRDGLRTMIDMYAAGLAQFDTVRLSRYFDLLADPAFLADSLVIVFSDHGEDLVPGQLFDHGGDLTEGKLRVVLAVAGPGWPAGRLAPCLCSLVDVLPTCLGESVGATVATACDGESLRDRMAGRVPLRAAYAESWNYQSDEPAERPRHGPLAGHNWMLHQRGLRTDRRLWVRRGLPIRLDEPRLQHADDATFVQTLYRELLGRYEDPNGLAGYVHALHTGRHSRRSLYGALRFSRELWDRPRLVRYDIARDPESRRPIPARRGHWWEGFGVERRLRQIEAAAVAVAPLDLNLEQQQEVCERLQALGYLE
jgi:arylsulfatase A-like enzyme